MQNDGHIARLSEMHTKLFGVVHGGPIFLPFHRRIVQDFEDSGKRYDPNFFVPYWDATRDYQNPDKSVVFNPDYLGGNGDPSRDNCISNGVQFGWNMSYPQPHCLRRIFNGPNGTMKSWYSPETMTSTLQTSTGMDNFRSNLEFTLHGAVHLGVSGDMTTPEAPNDFVFYLHHSNMDRLWWKWQNSQEKNLMDYGGKNPEKSSPAALSDTIDGYNETISDVMRMGYGVVCSIYDDVVPLPSLNLNSTALRNLKTVTTTNMRASNSTSTLQPKISSSSKPQDDDGSDFVDQSMNLGLRTLSAPTLEKFFPALKSSEINLNLVETSGAKLGVVLGNVFSTNSLKRRGSPVPLKYQPVYSSSSRVYNNKPKTIKKLPVPIMPPDRYIMMHKYKRSDVERAVNRCIDLVNTLNNEGYVSPF
ncbi:Tyrosinase [Smittium culicis]|uniref:Tyrosinase n=1 Tax=Smittium culicis TaxID=133412 RepID=A0A1R1YG85_9FUNG|nr:Tyrosinase [Smittium culicis]